MSLHFAARRAISRQLRAEAGPIAEAVTDDFLRRHPDWTERYGELARRRGLEDAHFHIEFLIGALLSGDPASFARYAVWTAGVLSTRRIGADFLIENLEQVATHAAPHLYPEARAEVDRLIAAGIAAIRTGRIAGAAADATGEAVPGERGLYLQATLAGDRTAALNIALEALKAGASVLDVYQDMLQPAQYEVGRLWESNSITVAREHEATAVTQYVISRLHEHFPARAESRGNAVVTGVRHERHQLGAAMVADVLEADGWNVRFLGTQVPHGDIVAVVDEHDAQVIGISVALLSHLEAVADLIDALRAGPRPDVRIIVGGAAFRFDHEAWRDLGADGFGRDLRETRDIVRQLTTR
jgi:MerR family transcriptional regulator, light-induced transcriptional regulator